MVRIAEGCTEGTYRGRRNASRGGVEKESPNDRFVKGAFGVPRRFQIIEPHSVAEGSSCYYVVLVVHGREPTER